MASRSDDDIGHGASLHHHGVKRLLAQGSICGSAEIKMFGRRTTKICANAFGLTFVLLIGCIPMPYIGFTATSSSRMSSTL